MGAFESLEIFKSFERRKNENFRGEKERA